jgi:hypothetical protein
MRERGRSEERSRGRMTMYDIVRSPEERTMDSPAPTTLAARARHVTPERFLAAFVPVPDWA